jgi:diguanylate cyclase (GGDEF)-like protein
METVRLEKLLTHQKNILSKIALGIPLADVLNEICFSVEEILANNSVKCSILRLKGEQLYHCASPNIDVSYSNAINGVFVGPNTGSCGTAVFMKKRVIVHDIETSPFWENFKDLALKSELRACWSTPIISSSSKILGTLAIYHSTTKKPSAQELELIDYFAHFSSIALEKNSESIRIKQLITDLEQSNNKFEVFTKVMPDLSLILSEDGYYADIYGSSNDLLYLPKNELLTKKLTDVLPRKTALLILEIIKKTVATNKVQLFEYDLEVMGRNLTFEGRAAYLANYQPNNPNEKYVVCVVRDITSRKNTEKEIKRLAFYDSLTNLPNRRMLNDKLNQSVEKIKDTNGFGVLLFLDLDNFKRINDSLGHAAGDQILVELTHRLKTVIDKSSTLARVGGDEFIVLVEYICDNHQEAITQSEKVAKKLLSTFNEKFILGKLAFQISCSIGICLIDKENADKDNILKFADTAMYRSKMKGGNSASFYDPELQTLLENQAKLETDIVRAIASDEFCAYFQPQVDTSGQIIGAEALIRWIHPTKGLIAPREFISLAEQYGLIQELQNIVLRDICILLNLLSSKNLINGAFNISINISQCQFNSVTLKTELFRIINEYNILPSQIKLEITESMLSVDIDNAIQQMEELKKAGFTFSIDDFGTGYSCLAHLNAFPVNELKIDKSFIDKILDAGTGFNIVQTIIGLGKSLKLSVVAEGVETLAQFETLKTIKINSLQGYLIAKPMNQHDYFTWHKNKLNK